MDILLLILQIELLLLTLITAPVLMTRYLVRRNRPLQALPWAKVTLATSRVIPIWRGFGNLNVATCYLMADDFPAAQRHAEQAVSFFARHPSPRFRSQDAMARAYLGIALSRSGQMREAEALLDSALALGVRVGPIRSMTDIYAAGVYIQRGRLADAAQLIEPILAAPKLSADYRIAAETLLAAQKYFMEDFAGGLALARQAMGRKTAATRLTLNATLAAQICLIELGDLREAQTLEAGMMAQIAEAPRNLQAGALRASGSLALKLGNLDRARDQAERASSLDPTPNAQAASLLIQAEVFALRQNFQRAASLTDAVLRSDAIDFYQRRARALQSRLSAPPTPTLL